MKVKDIMSKKVYYFGPDKTLDLIKETIEKAHVRHVPVIDKNQKLLGLITHRDILRMAFSEFGGIDKNKQNEFDRVVTAKEVMRTKVITTTAQTDLREVARVMIDHKIGCLPVLEDEKVVGLITEADFLKLADRF